MKDPQPGCRPDTFLDRAGPRRKQLGLGLLHTSLSHAVRAALRGALSHLPPEVALYGSEAQLAGL